MLPTWVGLGSCPTVCNALLVCTDKHLPCFSPQDRTYTVAEREEGLTGRIQPDTLAVYVRGLSSRRNISARCWAAFLVESCYQRIVEPRLKACLHNEGMMNGHYRKGVLNFVVPVRDKPQLIDKNGGVMRPPSVFQLFLEFTAANFSAIGI